MEPDITTDVEMIMKTGRYIFDGVLFGFSKARRYQKLTKFSQSDFINRKYTGVEKKLLQNFMVESFTVAGVLNYDLQEKLKEAAAEILKREDESDPKKLFIEEAKKIIPQYQYDGKIPPEGHLKTNFRTAVTSAYHGSLWQTTKAAGIYTALEYNTRRDPKVRPEHATLDGLIYYIDDPIWNTIYAPNDWNCRCFVTPKTVDELVGKEVQSPLRDPEATRKIIKDAGISKEFARNSGMTESIWGKWLDTELSGKNVDKIFSAMKDYAKDNMPAEDSIVKESLKQSPKLFDASNEVWGSRTKSGEGYSSSVTFIRIKKDYFEVIISNDGALSEVKKYDLSRLDDFRKGVLIKINK